MLLQEKKQWLSAAGWFELLCLWHDDDNKQQEQQKIYDIIIMVFNHTVLWLGFDICRVFPHLRRLRLPVKPRYKAPAHLIRKFQLRMLEYEL